MNTQLITNFLNNMTEFTDGMTTETYKDWLLCKAIDALKLEAPVSGGYILTKKPEARRRDKK